MIFRRKFSVPKICCPSRSKQLIVMPLTVKFRLGFWGDQPFSCPCLQNVMHCRKEICSTCLSMESMPFVKSKPPLTRSLRFLRATACSISSALWLDHAHPFVAAAEKRPVSCREAEGLVTKLWSPRITIY